MEGLIPCSQRKVRCIGREAGSTILMTSSLQEQQWTLVCQVSKESSATRPRTILMLCGERKWPQSVPEGLGAPLWKSHADLGGGLRELPLLQVGYCVPEEMSQGRLHTDHSAELFPRPCTPVLRAHTGIARNSTYCSHRTTELSQGSGEEQPLISPLSVIVNLGISNNKSSQNMLVNSDKLIMKIASFSFFKWYIIPQRLTWVLVYQIPPFFFSLLFCLDHKLFRTKADSSSPLHSTPCIHHI